MTVGRRFLFSFGTNLARAALSLLVGVIVARGLGPSDYGNLAYLLGSFWALRALLDLGASSAFYTFISQQHRARAYYIVYFTWLGIQFSVSALVVGLLLPDALFDRFWLGQDRPLVILGLIATFLQNQVWQTVVQMHESLRQTVRVQTAAFIVIAAHLLLMALFFAFDLLSVSRVLWALVIEYAVAAYALSIALRRSLRNLAPPATAAFSETIGAFVAYCRPMIVVAVFSFAYEMTDRWLLQRFGGASQQGFYQVAMQLSTVSLLATTSILHVLWKEVAEANAQGLNARVIALHRRATRILMLAASFISCFLAAWSEELVSLLLGEAYRAAWPALFVMLFYPVHQAMGQMNGTLFMATGRTSPYMRITVAGLLVSMPISALMLLPPDSSMLQGFGLGALGLAIKTAGLNALFTNIQAWMIARQYGERHTWIHQFTAILILLALGYSSRELVILMFVGNDFITVAASLLAGGIFYTSASLAAMAHFPGAFGLSRSDVDMFICRIKQAIRSGQ